MRLELKDSEEVNSQERAGLEWELELPDRTVFYPLRAKAINTPFVEGLTGYTRRLAAAHRVTVADLVCHPHFDNLFVDPDDHRNRRRLFVASGYLLDDTDSYTHKWIEALEAATGQSGLQSLTLSQFAGASSFSWLRRRRAWCPRCLSVQAETDPDDLYEPLLWSIRLVSNCPIDTSPLVELCPTCKGSTRPFDGVAAPGYCGRCGSPLWSNQSPERVLPDSCGTTSFQLWCSVQAALLLEALNEFAVPLLPPTISRALAATFGSMMEQSRSAAAHAAGCSKRTTYLWAKGLAVPRIESIFRLCFNLGLSPLDLFRKAMCESAHADESSGAACKGSETIAATATAQQLTFNFSIRKPNGRIHYDHVTRGHQIRDVLEKAIAPMPPPTLHAAARLLKMSNSTILRQLEPVLSNQLDERRKRWEQSELSRIQAKFQAVLREPSLSSSFEQFCLHSGFSISFVTRELPDLKAAYIAKHRALKCARRRAQADEHSRAVAQAVEILGVNGEYPSVGRVKAQSEKLRALGWDEIQAYIRECLAPEQR
jgi:hypothetical protein